MNNNKHIKRKLLLFYTITALSLMLFNTSCDKITDYSSLIKDSIEMLPITKAKDADDSLLFHRATSLLIQKDNDSGLIPADEARRGEDLNGYDYALKVYPKTYIEQLQIEQTDGITVSYIPFGYKIVRNDSGDGYEEYTEPYSIYTERSVALKKCNESDELFLEDVTLPTMYVIWPREKELPTTVEYEIAYYKKHSEEGTRIQYPSRYYVVFRTYDSILSTYVRLSNLKISVSTSSGTTNYYTNDKGFITINSNSATYASEPLTYTMTAVFSSPKWNITRAINTTTPIHTSFGALSQHVNYSNLSDTVYVNVASVSTECTIHRALDYYHNMPHDLTSTILSSEYSLIASAPDSSSLSRPGYETWNSNYARIVILKGQTAQDLIGTVFHEIGHARKDYYQGSFYNNNQQKLIHESYASLIGFDYSRKYYTNKGLSLMSTSYVFFNTQHRQQWTSTLDFYSPLFVDFLDNLNQSDYYSSALYVNDSISDIPIYPIDRVGISSTSMTSCRNQLNNMVSSDTFSQNELDTLLSLYF